MQGALHQAVPDPWNLVDVLNNPLHSARQPSRRVFTQIQMGQQSRSIILQTQKCNAGCVTTPPTWRCSSGWSTVSISFAASSCSSSLCARSVFAPVCVFVFANQYVPVCVFVYILHTPHRCLPGEREEQGAGAVRPVEVGAQRIRQNFARNDGNDRNGRSLRKCDFDKTWSIVLMWWSLLLVVN